MNTPMYNNWLNETNNENRKNIEYVKYFYNNILNICTKHDINIIDDSNEKDKNIDKDTYEKIIINDKGEIKINRGNSEKTKKEDVVSLEEDSNNKKKEEVISLEGDSEKTKKYSLPS